MKIIDTKSKEVVFVHGSMYPSGVTAEQLEALAVRSETGATRSETAADRAENAWSTAQNAPIYQTRAAASAAAALMPVGTSLYVQNRRYVVDTVGIDRLLAIDMDWSGQAETLMARMKQGDAIRIACYGDSTTDGHGTTDWTLNPKNGAGDAIGSAAHTPPNAWPWWLESTLRLMNANYSIGVWNAGYGSTSIVTGWALRNFATAIINNPGYGTPNACIINYGLNDLLAPEFTVAEFRKQLNYLLSLMEYYGVTPILMSPDPVIHNTARQAGNMCQVNDVYKAAAADYGLMYIDNFTAMDEVYSGAGSKQTWFANQPDRLHGGDGWHRNKGAHASCCLFPNTLWLDRNSDNIAAWSQYSNTDKLTYSTYAPNNNIFGANANAAIGTYDPGQILITAWVWVKRDNVTSFWRSVDGDGYYYPRPLADAPAIATYSYLNGGAPTLRKSQMAGRRVGGAGNRESETPMSLGGMPRGLNRFRFIAPSDNADSSVFLGYFSFRELKFPVSVAARIPPSGTGMALYAADVESAGQLVGFGVGRTLRMTFDFTAPNSTGFIMYQGRVFGDAEAESDNHIGGLMLWKGPNVISLYQTRSANGVPIIYPALVSATHTWSETSNLFTAVFNSTAGGVTVNVYADNSNTPVLTYTKPVSDYPFLSGGNIGGLLANHEFNTGGLAKAIVYDATY